LVLIVIADSKAAASRLAQMIIAVRKLELIAVLRYAEPVSPLASGRPATLRAPGPEPGLGRGQRLHNTIAAAPGWRNLAIWAMPPAASTRPATPSPHRGQVRGETKTSRFLSLVAERHGPLAAIPLLAAFSGETYR
jgi:hypothetical protein